MSGIEETISEFYNMILGWLKNRTGGKMINKFIRDWSDGDAKV